MNRDPKTLFPIKLDDREKVLKFFFNDVKLMLEQGFNQILIHSDGKGMITGVEERRVRR